MRSYFFPHYVGSLRSLREWLSFCGLRCRNSLLYVIVRTSTFVICPDEECFSHLIEILGNWSRVALTGTCSSLLQGVNAQDNVDQEEVGEPRRCAPNGYAFAL
ncbi:hypothetical protein AVEN_96423-1 [Araneus ventricosus]|uniref:Uncharacterized protein n=1 Tax=Araneus ventricosus TaxID=182803 RepID=A0A4Y2HXD9_ARAVE|nr:hypothetical protein AVEN_96423-1 [Araneus ventricosus]